MNRIEKIILICAIMLFLYIIVLTFYFFSIVSQINQAMEGNKAQLEKIMIEKATTPRLYIRDYPTNENEFVAGTLEPIIIEKEKIIEIQKPPLLAADILERDYFTFDERDKLIDILNIELKEYGALSISKIADKKALLTSIITELEKQPVKAAKITVAGKEYGKEDYLTIRSILFNKLKQ